MDLNYLDNITGLEFEKFALTILEYEARKLGKKIVLDKETSEYLYSHYLGVINHGFHIFDAIAPEGLYDSKVTFFIIKFFRRKNDEVYSQIGQLVHRCRDFMSQSDLYIKDYDNIKFVFITNVPNEFKQNRAFADSGLFQLWSFDDLLDKSKLYPFEYNAFIELAISKNTSKRGADELRKMTTVVPDSDIDMQNSNLIDELKNEINRKGIGLVLGTGISMDYNNNLSWNELTNRMYSELPKSKQFNDEKNAFSILGDDNISKSQYSKHNLGNSFPTIIYKLLYPIPKVYSIGLTSLDECANLVLKKNSSTNNGIKKVLTYNYDNYFEQALSARFVKYNILFTDDDSENIFLSIFHLHGYLPEDIKSPLKEKYAKALVLSESDYFDSYNDSSNWLVAVQLTTFKNDVCLFVGNSIKDFNERRLLNRTKQKNKSHFAIMDSKGLDGNDLSKIHSFFFYELNVRIIWADGTKEIPDILRRINT